MAELFNRGVEGPFWGEGTDVHFIDQCRRKRFCLPMVVGPCKGRVVHSPRRAMNTERLKLRARVRKGPLIIDDEFVIVAKLQKFRIATPATVLFSREP